MQWHTANYLAISGLLPHIKGIVTGAWTLNGSAGARILVTDFTSYPLAVSGEVSPETFCPGSSQHPRDTPNLSPDCIC
jgi:hypothetical protein